jgi:hypothetical protein
MQPLQTQALKGKGPAIFGEAFPPTTHIDFMDLHPEFD